MARILAKFTAQALLLLLAISSVQSQTFEGDKCTFAETRAPGVCTSLRTCVPAKNGLKKGKSPQICSFVGTIPIVCCVQSEEPEPVTSRMPPLPPQLNQGDPNVCPAVPSKATTITKTGQKAWDYCIDLSESVYTCIRSGFTLSAPLIRHNDCAHVSTPLIVGGSPTTPGEFPHMALLGFGEQGSIEWDCGGTLISKDWVMTAAHCTFKRETGEVKHIRLGGGDTNTTVEPKYYYSVSQIIRHPDYAAPAVYNDIALLKLDRSATFTRLVRPACLHTGDAVNDKKAIASGWGTTSSRGQKSHSLLKVTLEKFNYEECAEKNPATRRAKDGVRDGTQLCAGHRTEIKDACQGDSGGPLQIYNSNQVECTYKVIGVTSNGKTCGVPGQPAIYTRVSAYIPWIESIVWP